MTGPGGRAALVRLRGRATAIVILIGFGSPAARAQSLDWQLVTATERGPLTYAIEVGREAGFPLYACRAKAGKGVQTGRFRKDFTGCHVGQAGHELSVIPFEVLGAAWQEASAGEVPAGSFPAGGRVASAPTGLFGLAPSYPCRAVYHGNTQVGAVTAGDRGCSFGYGGRQVTELTYQVLWQAPWLHWAPGIPHQLPRGAVPAGTEAGEVFFMCRSSDAAGLQPGKIKQSSAGCSIASEGKEIVTTLFSVLVPRWLEGTAGTIPMASLPAGSEHERPLYLCRARIRDTVQIGKINEQLTSCRVGMMGGEIPVASYEILAAR